MRAAHRAKLAALTVGVVAVSAGLAVTTAGPASANAPCGWEGAFEDGTTVTMPSGVAANMRSGSSTSCGVKGWADNRDMLIYFCYTWGQNGSWTYVMNVDDETRGWVKDSLLPGNGSNYNCGL